MSGPGWHPDPTPGSPPGRLRWFDGRSWTKDVHPPEAAATVAPAGLLEAGEVVVGPPQAPAVGTRVFELTDPGGGRLGRLVETTRGAGSTLGSALSRADSFRYAFTREARDAGGWPQVLLITSPAMSGTFLVTLPDRREVGRVVDESGGVVGLFGHDGRRWGQVLAGRSVVSWDDRLVATISDSGYAAAAGWRISREHVEEPLRLLGFAAGLLADLTT